MRMHWIITLQLSQRGSAPPPLGTYSGLVDPVPGSTRSGILAQLLAEKASVLRDAAGRTSGEVAVVFFALEPERLEEG